MNKNKRHQKGQAFLELIIVLPALFFIILFGLQIFMAITKAQIKQEEVRQTIVENSEPGRGIYYQANGGTDKPPVVVEEGFSTPVRTLGLPVFGLDGRRSPPISIKIGICREPVGPCARTPQ